MKNSIAVPITLENENEKRHLLTIPYEGEKGDYLIESVKRSLKNMLRNNVKPQITYAGRKLGSSFQTKDHIGETDHRVNEKIVDNTGRDANSHLLKQSIESGHKPLEAIGYKITGKGYCKNTMNRKLSEALFILR